MKSVNDKFLEKQYKLKDSPFEKKVSRDSLHFWVDREDPLKVWKMQVEKGINGVQNQVNFIIGDYGMGKTLALFKIKDEFEDRTDVYETYMQLLSESRHKGGMDFLFRLFKEVDFKTIQRERSREDINKAISHLPEDEKFADSKQIFRNIFISNRGVFSYADEDNADIPTNTSSNAELAITFLKGGTISERERKKLLKINRKIDDLEDAKVYLAAWLIFMKSLKYEAVLVLVDEFENLFYLVNKAERERYLALFRSLFDLADETNVPPETMSTLILFFASTQSGWEHFNELDDRRKVGDSPSTALIERVNTPVFLEPLTFENSKLLIERRLKFNRVDDKIEDTPLIPFTESFVKFIHDETGGVPRAIIKRCDKILDAGIEKRVSEIDDKFAKEVIDDLGYLSLS